MPAITEYLAKCVIYDSISQPAKLFNSIEDAVEWLLDINNIYIAPLNGEASNVRSIADGYYEVWVMYEDSPESDYCFGHISKLHG